jgi:hypothetical protein
MILQAHLLLQVQDLIMEYQIILLVFLKHFELEIHEILLIKYQKIIELLGIIGIEVLGLLLWVELQIHLLHQL